MLKFYAKSHAKWILSGEHTVLRGGTALVFPIPDKFIELWYWENKDPEVAGMAELTGLEFDSPHDQTFTVLFWTVFEAGLALLQKKRQDISGRLYIKHNIPMGAGVGFSAAFCVTLTKFFQYKQFLFAHEAFEFARQLENHFHGKSSGVDIAGSLYDQGIAFQMNGTKHLLVINWKPKLYLSYSGHVSVTSSCVKLVNDLQMADQAKANVIDRQMIASVKLAMQALTQDAETGLRLLAQAIQDASDCFLAWGLINTDLFQHITLLKQHGALACKPTGAGDGGYVLSLWHHAPPKSLTNLVNMINVFS